VRLLGLVEFDAICALQEWIAYELSGRNDGQGVLILCEHPPLITIGREGSRAQITASEDELAAAQMPIRWISRSGGAVVHAPGQLAAYLLVPLDRLQITLREYRQRLETALLNVCHELRVPAKRVEEGGLWTRGGQVGHFGAVVKSWVTQHGMWLNVHPPAGFLRMVRSNTPAPRAGESARLTHETSPADCAESRITSLQDQLLRRVSMHQAREATLRSVAAAFGYNEVYPFTGHPQLARTRRSVCTSPV
jgi:lipoate-protein ligase B